jgi:hypothetical protein
MRQLATTAALLTCCSALSACTTPQRIVEPLRPDRSNPERFICEEAGTRPAIAAEDPIDLGRIRAAPTVAQAAAIAQQEVDAYVASVRGRETVVSEYIVTLEGKHFTCVNNMAWQRDFYSRLPEPLPQP